jgi:hypothetical protein
MPDETEERKLPVLDERQLELFKEWVSVQKGEIGLKSKQLELREKELAVEESQVKLGHEYALKALEAQSHDREAQRVFRRKVMVWSLWFGVLLVVLFAAFSFYNKPKRNRVAGAIELPETAKHAEAEQFDTRISSAKARWEQATEAERKKSLLEPELPLV